MKKKTTVIELLNKKANNEDLPKKIRVWCGTYKDYFKYDEKEKWYVTYDDTTLLDVIDRLNNQIEILEDNTEEIEELDTDIHIDSFMDAELNFNKIAQEINKLGKTIRELRKEKE